MELTLPTEKNKNVIGLIKDELGGKIMTEFVALRAKTYSYLMDHGNSDSDTHAIKKIKGTKTYVIKRVLRFNDYKNRLLNNKIKSNSQQRFKMNHTMFILKKLTRLHLAAMMVKDCKILIDFHHILML